MPLLRLLLAMLLLIAGPARLAADDGASTATLRVISLAPSITEILFTLGAGDRVVAVTDFCRYPEQAATKAKVGGLHDPRFEQMLLLRPDVVFHLPSNAPVVGRLRERGIETIAVPSETVADIRTALRTVGARLGVEATARDTIAAMDAGLERVRVRTADRARPTVLFVVGHPPGVLREVYGAGPNTFLDELIAVAGGSNVLAESPVRYPVVARETLMRTPPDVVVEHKASGEPWTERERETLRALWLEYLGPAARGRTRVLFLDDPQVTVPGPSVVRHAEALAALLHPVE
ncbi:MAG: ABC transporter substrate-binding protein [Candidatus Sumerlaeia bacterium]|nr:ABC transporter substrate-binding protein [Candidatus Sumerlaeia bacterium]